MIGKEVNVGQNSAEWHELRRTRLTASEVSTVLANPAKAVRDYIAKSLGRQTFKGNAATEYGHEAEPLAADWFAKTAGVEVRTVGFVIDHHDPRMGCSPDRVFLTPDHEERLLEIKCPHSRDIPTVYDRAHWEQVQYQMGVTGIHRATLLYWAPDQIPKAFVIDFDKEWWHDALKQIKSFWALVDDVIDQEAFLDAQSEPRSDPEWVIAADAWAKANEALKDAQEVEAEARRQLIELSGNVPAEGGRARLTWVVRKGNVNWQAVTLECGIPTPIIEKHRGKETRYAKLEAL